MPNSLAVAHAPPMRERRDDTHRKEQLSRPPERGRLSGQMASVIMSTARPEPVRSGLANQIDTAEVCPSAGIFSAVQNSSGRFYRRR